MKQILFISLLFRISSYTSQEKEVWDFFVEQMKLTKQATAGLMANIKELSGINSVYYDTYYQSQLGISAQEYVDKVNDGSYSENDFIYDGVGFGLLTWIGSGRKQELFNFCKGKIGNLNCQLNFF